MYQLTNQQIEFILNDIRARGVEMVSLQHDLLDHICCAIEQKLDPDGDFDDFYKREITNFYKSDLAEIERETISLLTFKNYYIMKKLMLISGAASVMSMTAGLIFKFMHWPGAALFILIGVLLLSFVFLPLLFTLKIRENGKSRDKVITGIGVIGGILISLAALFKVFHWPGATVIGLSALAVMTLVFLPVYFITGVRRPETKVNTIVSSVFIFYGCAITLMMIRSSHATQDLMRANAMEVMRAENLLNGQQRLVSGITSDAGWNAEALEVGKLASELKDYLISCETGRSSLRSGDMISDTEAGIYMAQSASAIAKLAKLENQIARFNESAPKLEIPSLVDFGNRKLSSAINDLILIEMAALQNQTATALLK